MKEKIVLLGTVISKKGKGFTHSPHFLLFCFSVVCFFFCLCVSQPSKQAMALPRVDAMTARRVVAGEALCVLIALVLAENKDAVGSWIAVAVPLILQDVTLFLSLLRLQSKKAALLWAVPVVAKLLADIIVPLHADGVVQGMTSLILMPVHVFALSIFASFFVIYIVKLRDP